MHDSRIHVMEILGNAIVGGMERYVSRLVERLAPQHFAFTCLCPYESSITRELRRHGAQVHVSPMPLTGAPWQTIRLACAIARAKDISVLHAHLPNAHALAGITGRLTGKPVLATLHGCNATTEDVEVERLTGSHLHVVCEQSYYQALSLGVEARQLHLIPNGVDDERFTPAEAGAPRMLQSLLGLGQETSLIGFVGRLSPEKGPHNFLRAAAVAQGSLPAVHFVLVGDGPMRTMLKKMALDLGLSGRVHFAGIQENMPEVYRSLDLLALSSVSEAMPFALMEAMACGVPVVAGDVGGVPEIIENEASGILVAAQEPDALGEGIVKLFSDREKRAALSIAARRRIKAQFSIEPSVRAMSALLTRVAGLSSERRMATVAAVPSGPRLEQTSAAKP